MVTSSALSGDSNTNSGLSLSQNSFQAAIQSPLQIFHSNIKHLIISEGEMQHGGHEKQTCRQDRAPWCMDGPRSRCFVLELGVKPTQGVHSVAATMGNSIFGERQKIQNSSVCYMGEEICRRESGRGQQLHLKGKNIF